MGKFDESRRLLIDYLRTADGEDYDAVYFFIGERDYDRADDDAVGKVADYFLEKGSSVRDYPYYHNNPITADTRVYKHGFGAPEELREFISRREERIREAEKNGKTYIPFTKGFDRMITKAKLYGCMTEEESREYDRASITHDYSKVNFGGGPAKRPEPDTSEIIMVIVVAIIALVTILASS